MPYTKALPEWNAGGIKPPQSKLDAGWQVDEKPPASWWNWYMYTAYQSLLELQQNAVHGEKLGANNGVATLGSDGKLTAAQLPAIGSGQITDGSITNNELATDVKVGSLASLTTTQKGSVTAAVNDVKSILDTHTGNATIHVTTTEKNAWNSKAAGVHSHPISDVTGLQSALDGKSSTSHTHANATTSADGFMSSTDKTAIDNAQKWRLTDNNGNSKAIATSDADNEKEAGFFATYSNTLNVPEVGGHLQVIKRDVNQSVQVFYGLANRNVYVRYWVQYWTPWKRLTDNNLIGGVLLGNDLVDIQTANFVNKVAGSTTANPHDVKWITSSNAFTTLNTPGTSNWGNASNEHYTSISILDSSLFTISRTFLNTISQVLFSFDIIAHVERTYGTIPGATTADKVSWLRANISKLTFNWYGFGSSPSGNKATVSVWDRTANGWGNSGATTSSTVAKVTRTSSGSSIDVNIDANGFAHFLAYADPSNGTTASVVNTDYVELQVELSTSLKDNMKPVWIDATLQNGWVEFAAALKPQYSIGFDGFVTLKGGIKSGTLNTTIMTLPVGFRPTKSCYYLVPGDTTSKSSFRITVQQDGQVLLVHYGGTSNNDFVGLDGIQFPTS